MKNEYEVRGVEVAIFVRYRGEIHECLIDLDDLEKVKSVDGTWVALKHHTGRYYVRTSIKRKKVLIHRFLMDPDKLMVVDHINHNTLDNRRGNLRVITGAQNRQNQSGAKRDNKTGVRGVGFDKIHGLYKARVYKNNKSICIGYFKTLDEAEKAVKEARSKILPYSQEAL